MKNINDLLNENNFFKNLGIGRINATKKWIEDNSDYKTNKNFLNNFKFYHKLNDDGTITVDSTRRHNIPLLAHGRDHSVKNSENPLVIPSYITIREYNNPIGSSVYLKHLQFENIE